MEPLSRRRCSDRHRRENDMADNISFKCLRCGSTKLEMPEKPKASDVVTCAGCGAQESGTKVAIFTEP
jgi:transcription elongation factor Elf1